MSSPRKDILCLRKKLLIKLHTIKMSDGLSDKLIVPCLIILDCPPVPTSSSSESSPEKANQSESCSPPIKRKRASEGENLRFSQQNRDETNEAISHMSCGQISEAYRCTTTHGLGQNTANLIPKVENSCTDMYPPPPTGRSEESLSNGQISETYRCTTTHGLGQNIANLIPNAEDSSTNMYEPPPPTGRLGEPLVSVSKDFDESVTSRRTAADENLVEGLGDNADLALDEEESAEDSMKIDAGDESGWDVEDADLDLLTEVATSEFNPCRVTAPIPGIAPSAVWTSNSKLVVDHVLAGSFESAFRLLHDQIGVVNYEPFKQLFITTYARSRVVISTIPSLPLLYNYPCRSIDTNPDNVLPAIGCKLTNLIKELQSCYQLTTSGEFQEAIEHFRCLLLNVTFLVVENKQEISKARQLLETCREYVLGLLMLLKRKSLPKESLDQHKHICEMAVYITHCKLEPIHQMLTLQTAVNLLFKLKNYKMAGSFAHRLLELGPGHDVAQQTRKILQVCGTNPVDNHQLQYNEHNPFTICGKSYKIIYCCSPEEKCPLCQTSYLPEFKGTVCNVCSVSEIGKHCIGLRISSLQF